MKRTPRNYNGCKNPAKKIDALLSGFLEGISPKKSAQKDEIFKAWYDIIGVRLKDLTKPLSLFDGTLVVSIKTQTLYSLLCTHEKDRILRDLQKRFSKRAIKDIQFRIG